MIEYHDILNPILWDGYELKTEIRDKLLEIYNTFKNQLQEKDIPIDVIDVLLLGSNASYNYTDNSDIDLHLVVDFKDVPLTNALTQLFYNAEKNEFNDNYDIMIKGLEVEVYIEDIDAGTKSNGIYSLLLNRWLRYPKYEPPEEVDYSDLLNKYKTKVQEVLINNSLEQIKQLINEIKMMRKLSLNETGEYSPGNLVFKELRNDGSIDSLYDKLHELTSKKLSLEDLKLTENVDDISNIINKLNELPSRIGISKVSYDLVVKYKNLLKKLPVGTKFGFKDEAGYETYEKISSNDYLDMYITHIPPPYRDNEKKLVDTDVAQFLAGRARIAQGPFELLKTKVNENMNINEANNADNIKLELLIKRYNSNIDKYAKNIEEINRLGKIDEFIHNFAINPKKCMLVLNNFYLKNNNIYEYDDLYDFTGDILCYDDITQLYGNMNNINPNWGISLDGEHFDYNLCMEFSDRLDILKLINVIRNAINVGEKTIDYLI